MLSSLRVTGTRRLTARPGDMKCIELPNWKSWEHQAASLDVNSGMVAIKLCKCLITTRLSALELDLF